MTDEKLIARLRYACYLAFDDGTNDFGTAPEAADRIEALTKERDEADDLTKAAFADGASNNIRLAETSYRVKWLEAKLAECEARLSKAVELLEAWGDVAVHCSIEEGVCCCGDNMENHTNPMDCGHTPLDHGTYIAGHLEETTRSTLAEIKGGNDAKSDL
jgi:hypothetical protein